MVLNTSIDANIRNCLPLPSHRRKSPGKSMGKFSSIFSVFPSKPESFFLCRLLKSSPSFSSFTPPTRAAFSVFLRPHVLVNLDSTNAFNSQLPTKPSLSSSSPSSMSSSSSSVSSLESSSELYLSRFRSTKKLRLILASPPWVYFQNVLALCTLLTHKTPNIDLLQKSKNNRRKSKIFKKSKVF